jgi:hypothetical protein
MSCLSRRCPSWRSDLGGQFLVRRLAAELGLLAFKRAFACWSDPANQQELSELARQSLHERHAASAALT